MRSLQSVIRHFSLFFIVSPWICLWFGDHFLAINMQPFKCRTNIPPLNMGPHGAQRRPLGGPVTKGKWESKQPINIEQWWIMWRLWGGVGTPPKGEVSRCWGKNWFFHGFFYGFLWFPIVFLLFFHGFFKELDFKELEIHRYSLMDIHQWISMDVHWWIHWWTTINESIDGPSMNMGSFLWAPSFGPHWAAFGPHGARAAPGRVLAEQYHATTETETTA